MKKIGILMYLTLLLLYCGDAVKVELKSSDKSQEKIAEQMFGYFNQHEWVKMAEMYTDSALFLDPSLGTQKVFQSKQQIIQKYTDLQSVFPDIRDSIIHIFPSGNDMVTIEFISKGTAADKSVFELPICAVLKIVDGKIVEDHTYYNNAP